MSNRGSKAKWIPVEQQAGPNGGDVDQSIFSKYCELYLEEGCWKCRWRKDVLPSHDMEEGRSSEPVVLGPSREASRTGLTKGEAQSLAWKRLLLVMLGEASAQQTRMTVASFVERHFVPAHVARMKPSSQTHYLAMLKHVLRPEEPGHVLRATSKAPKSALASDPDWPYLSQLRLCDVRPEHVSRVTAAATRQGYSAQTVSHIRNVMSALFEHAIREQYFLGDNPVRLVAAPEAASTRMHSLTLSQAKEALALMKHPEKEMMLIAILMDISMSEICGLQWKRVNLTGRTSRKQGDPIPPRTIAVRKQWYRDTLEDVNSNRARDIAIPEMLLQILGRLKDRGRFTAPDDFVFASRQGTPVNPNNIIERRLKPLARQLGLPSVSWQVFRRTRKALVADFETQGTELVSDLIRFAYPDNVLRRAAESRADASSQSQFQSRH
jgi:integrase